MLTTAIDGLDPTDLGAIEIHVSEAWARRLKAEPLQGLRGYPIIADEDLYDGDVRLFVNDAQVGDCPAGAAVSAATRCGFRRRFRNRNRSRSSKEAVAQSAALADDAADAD